MTKSSLSIIFSSFLLLLFSVMAYQALEFQLLARYFPLTIALVAAALTLLQLILEVKNRKKDTKKLDINFATMKYLLWILGYVALIFIIGFIIATILFLFAFLKLETKFSFIKTALVVALTMAVVYVFSAVMSLYWPVGFLF